MVDLRVNVIGPAGKHDPPVSGILEELDRLLTLSAHIIPARRELLPCVMYGRADLLL